MRINVYGEELPEVEDEQAVRRVSATANNVTYFGARLFLLSPKELHNEPWDDDRSAVTI